MKKVQPRNQIDQIEDPKKDGLRRKRLAALEARSKLLVGFGDERLKEVKQGSDSHSGVGSGSRGVDDRAHSKVPFLTLPSESISTSISTNPVEAKVRDTSASMNAYIEKSFNINKPNATANATLQTLKFADINLSKAKDIVISASDIGASSIRANRRVLEVERFPARDVARNSEPRHWFTTLQFYLEMQKYTDMFPEKQNDHALRSSVSAPALMKQQANNSISNSNSKTESPKRSPKKRSPSKFKFEGDDSLENVESISAEMKIDTERDVDEDTPPTTTTTTTTTAEGDNVTVKNLFPSNSEAILPGSKIKQGLTKKKEYGLDVKSGSYTKLSKAFALCDVRAAFDGYSDTENGDEDNHKDKENQVGNVENEQEQEQKQAEEEVCIEDSEKEQKIKKDDTKREIMSSDLEYLMASLQIHALVSHKSTVVDSSIGEVVKESRTIGDTYSRYTELMGSNDNSSNRNRNSRIRTGSGSAYWTCTSSWWRDRHDEWMEVKKIANLALEKLEARQARKTGSSRDNHKDTKKDKKITINGHGYRHGISPRITWADFLDFFQWLIFEVAAAETRVLHKIIALEMFRNVRKMALQSVIKMASIDSEFNGDVIINAADEARRRKEKEDAAIYGAGIGEEDEDDEDEKKKKSMSVLMISDGLAAKRANLQVCMCV